MSGALRLITKEGGSHLAKPGQTLVIGRKKDCDIVVTETTISRQHARIEIMENSWHVTDLDSSNGTFVNGKRVAVSELKNGDELRTGSIPFLVEIEEVVVVGGGRPPAPEPVPKPLGAAAPAAPAPPPLQPPPGPSPEKPRRRGARAKREREKEGNDSRKRQPRGTSSTRRDRGPRPDQKNMMPYYALGGSFGFLLLVLVVIVLFSDNKPRRVVPAPPPVQPTVGGTDLEEARRLYNEAAKLMMKKDYKKAWPAVDRAHTFHMQLLDKSQYRNNGELQNHGRDLSIWRRQIAYVGNQEIMEEMERIKRSMGH